MTRYQDSTRLRSVRRQRNGAGIVLAILIGVAVVGAAIGIVSLGKSHSESHTAVCTVTTKDTITKVENGNSKTEKRVGTEECGVFTVNDNFFKGKNRSADLYYSLKEGHKYSLTYNGWRSGLFSSFPNITEAVEVK